MGDLENDSKRAALRDAEIDRADDVRKVRESEGQHLGCEVRGPHPPHEIVLQYVDVGVGGRGIPEYSTCPGLPEASADIELLREFNAELTKRNLNLIEENARLHATFKPYLDLVDRVRALARDYKERQQSRKDFGAKPSFYIDRAVVDIDKVLEGVP